MTAPARPPVSDRCRDFLHGFCEGCGCVCHPQGAPIPETQVQALHATQPGHERQRDAVLAALKGRPLTDREIAAAVEIDHRAASARRIELVTDGLVSDSGERRPEGPRGLRATVWAARPPADPDRLARVNRRKLLMRRVRRLLNGTGTEADIFERRLGEIVDLVEE